MDYLKIQERHVMLLSPLRLVGFIGSSKIVGCLAVRK